LHLVSQISEASFANPVVASTVFVLIGSSIALMLNFGSIPLSELGPTTRTVIVIPIFTRSFPLLPLERSSLQTLPGFNAPLLVRFHDAIISLWNRREGKDEAPHGVKQW
jgi:hypothetical protein